MTKKLFHKKAPEGTEGINLPEDIVLPDTHAETVALLETQLASLRVPAVPEVPVLQKQKDTVLLVGGGHISQEIASLATYADFDVHVLDVRTEYADRERFPDAQSVQLCSDYATFSTEHAISARHYVVILTHAFESDLIVLEQVLQSDARYIGVAGSERKKERLFAALREHNFPAAELACIRCPMGLFIGAETPEEVAIAVVAELIAARAGRLIAPHARRK